MKGEKLATGGVLALSALIASCCLGPALFLLFGVSVGALGALSILEPWRPYLIGAGGLLLGFAALRIFRPARHRGEAACEAGACGSDGRSRRLTRRLFWVALAAYLSAVAYPNVLAALLG